MYVFSLSKDNHNFFPPQAFIQDFTRVGQVKGHVSLEMFLEISTNGKDLGITKAT